MRRRDTGCPPFLLRVLLRVVSLMRVSFGGIKKAHTKTNSYLFAATLTGLVFFYFPVRAFSKGKKKKVGFCVLPFSFKGSFKGPVREKAHRIRTKDTRSMLPPSRFFLRVPFAAPLFVCFVEGFFYCITSFCVPPKGSSFLPPFL